MATSVFNGVIQDGGDPYRCPHIAEAFADEAEKARLLKKYKSMVAWKARRTHETIHPAKRRKLSSPECGTCGLSLNRPFVCLHCGYAGCWRDEHITEHLKDEGHLFSVDVKIGPVFCVECGDFIYDATIDNLFHSTVIAVEESNTKFQGFCCLLFKKRRERYRRWDPTMKDIAALEETISLPCQGRRGLLNLGQTCFLNVILQSIIHNPLLRNYFLSDKHNSKLCKAKDCTCCEIDKLFTEARASLLDYDFSIHQVRFYAADIHPFNDSLRPDIALERDVARIVRDFRLRPTRRARILYRAPQRDSPLLPRPYQHLVQLRRAQHIRRPVAKRRQVRAEVSKRLSIRKLPPVLSFQFKVSHPSQLNGSRFEHKSSDRLSAQKMVAPTRVPASINMAPYTTLAVNSTTATSRSKMDAVATAFPYPGPEALYEYDLFAVINHEGQIDNGHYTNFARVRDEWYRFDDDKVTPSTLPAVLSAPAPIYMAFYVKRRLDYKPYMTPSYVLTRETEAVREREREREKEREKEKELEREMREREEREREEREREEELEDELLATVG
ncbi:hypothetical protein EW146_g8064 [Bondarzewia mesenterica]|uniref:Ubiquitin carboxyl-terminal hydrolase n=1 Tax=Bondarzewia mesenterica TaxID=1095465 RepID=A0A4S4LJ89_9AGAM|nr:hypothetical protein EW146_g8064 [Bondarzewia mesenterica]